MWVHPSAGRHRAPVARPSDANTHVESFGKYWYNEPTETPARSTIQKLGPRHHQN